MLAGGMIEHVKNLSIGLNLYAEKLGEEAATEREQEIGEAIYKLEEKTDTEVVKEKLANI